MKSFLKNKVFIIAEAGVNHNGKLSLAKKLVDKAKMAGADAVKFQTFKADKLISQKTPKVGYQKRTTSKKESQYEMLKKLELSREDYYVLFKYCTKKKIMFLSTPFDEGSVDFLNDLGIKIFKISSGEITNFPLLKKIGNIGKPIILSTGMSTLAEVADAVKAIALTNSKDLTVLHCVTEYPTPFEDVNLKAMDTLAKKFKFPVGYSDHTLGIEVSVAAVARGAKVIEKHITLDRSMDGPDHKASLDPIEFKKMVSAIRNVESALGNGIKRPAKTELKYLKLVRKSLVAMNDIQKGSAIDADSIAIKRPGNGIAPKDLSRIIGKRAKVNIREDAILRWSQFE